MPQTITEPVQAQSLKVGDKVTLLELGIKDAVVDSKDAKTKWTYLDLEVSPGLSHDYRVPNDSVFTVEREVPTEEEKAAQLLRFQLEELDRKERGAAEIAAQARAKFEQSLGHGLPSSERLEELYVRQYAAAQWARIGRVSKIRAEKSIGEGGAGSQIPDRLEVARLVRDKVREEVTNFARWRPLSRSTSQTTNWMENCELQAKGGFIEDLAWILNEE